MIGAIVLKVLWKRNLERAFANRDINAMLKNWHQDGVLEFGGTHDMAGHFVGHTEIRRWLERWFTGMQELHVSVGRVALANPWSLTLNNTVMTELHIEEISHEGTAVTAEVLSVADVRRGKVVRTRDYPFDETPELVMWGPARPSASDEKAPGSKGLGPRQSA